MHLIALQSIFDGQNGAELPGQSRRLSQGENGADGR